MSPDKVRSSTRIQTAILRLSLLSRSKSRQDKLGEQFRFYFSRYSIILRECIAETCKLCSSDDVKRKHLARLKWPKLPLKTPFQLWIVFLGRVHVIESEPRVQHEKTVFETIAGLFQVLGASKKTALRPKFSRPDSSNAKVKQVNPNARLSSSRSFGNAIQLLQPGAILRRIHVNA